MRARSLLCVLAFVGLLVAVPTAVAYQFFPDAKNQLQRDWQELFTLIFWAALVVFVLVEGIILYSIIRFRKRKDGPSEGPHVHGNTKMEIAWTIAPTLVMAWLLMVSLDQLEKTDNNVPEPDIDIQVIGHQFYWEFIYPDNSEPVSGEFYVEEDKVVGLHVTSTDVIHAFNIPELGVMIDATPGRINYFWFIAEEPGEYFVQCRELCGVSHGRMHAKLVVFPAGSQERAYGKPTNGTESPTTSPVPTDTSPTGTSSTNGTSGPAPADATEVRLIDFDIDPKEFTTTPGQTIVLNVKNEGQQRHNLYIGKFDESAENAGALWFTEDLEGGESTTLEVELPAEAGAWEWWCNVPGHRSGYLSGMSGIFSTGGVPDEGKRPLLPGFEMPLVILAALGVAVLFARRRN